MNIDEIERRYNALPPAEDVPGSREWTDRTDTFADFMKNGPLVVASLKGLSADSREFCRSLAPDRWELLHEVFD
jgi:hypothetical protein